MVTCIIGRDAEKVQTFSGRVAAELLGPAERAGLSVEVLARTQPLSRLARQCHVSRKFLYEQGGKGRLAIDKAFAPPEEPEHRVLFNLPVTKEWIEQLVLAQVLIGHTSFRGVAEILDAVLDYPGLSIGTVHNIVQSALPAARAISAAQVLRSVRVGAHDEIYQAGHPVLVGADVDSTYCYLLSQEEHCDETTWGVHLLDLAASGLHPQYTVADGGGGLRAGQAAAWGQVPCHADVFHLQRELGQLAFYLQRRAEACAAACLKVQQRKERCRRRGHGNLLTSRLTAARRAEAAASTLANDIRILTDWLQEDILSLAGPSLADRRELFDFVVAELTARETFCPHRITPVRRALENHRDNLLAFAGVMEQEFTDLARQWDVPRSMVQRLCQLEGLDQGQAHYWQVRGRLVSELKETFTPLQQAVRAVMADTPRASSIIENLNSRLRGYFFLRRQLGEAYLDLLRFFLNHHPFQRSRRGHRQGKTPAELLSGQAHPHWLELLGFQRFHRN